MNFNLDQSSFGKLKQTTKIVDDSGLCDETFNEGKKWISFSKLIYSLKNYISIFRYIQTSSTLVC